MDRLRQTIAFLVAEVMGSTPTTPWHPQSRFETHRSVQLPHDTSPPPSHKGLPTSRLTSKPRHRISTHPCAPVFRVFDESTQNLMRGPDLTTPAMIECILAFQHPPSHTRHTTIIFPINTPFAPNHLPNPSASPSATSPLCPLNSVPPPSYIPPPNPPPLTCFRPPANASPAPPTTSFRCRYRCAS